MNDNPIESAYYYIMERAIIGNSIGPGSLSETRNMTVEEIIDKYGSVLSASQIEDLVKLSDKRKGHSKEKLEKEQLLQMRHQQELAEIRKMLEDE